MVPILRTSALAASLIAVTHAQEGPAHQIVGRIQGDGAAAAVVHVRWLAHPELPGPCLEALDTDPRREVVARVGRGGIFRCEVPVRGPFEVEATLPNGARAQQFPVMAGQVVQLEPVIAPTLAGVVVDRDAKPVAGAVVRTGPYSDPGTSLNDSHWYSPPREARTGPDGRFALPAPRDGGRGGRGLAATNGVHRSAERFYLLPGQTEPEVTLQLLVPHRLESRVLDSNRQPIADAVVRAHAWPPRQATSGADGRFELDVPPSSSLVVLAPGHAPARTNLSVGAMLLDQAMVGFRSGIPHAGAIRAVVASGGSPLADRDVVLVQRDEPTSIGVAWMTRTDADGRFVDRIAAPSLPVQAFVRDGERFLPCAPLGVAREAAVRLEPAAGHTLSGQVLDPDGHPAIGARVRWQPRPAGVVGPLTFRVTFTDHAGRFHFDGVVPTAGNLIAEAGFNGCAGVTVPASDDPERSLDLRIPAGSSQAGQVLDDAGKPLAGAQVQYVVVFDDADTSPTARFGMLYLRGTADEDGRFRVRGLPPHRAYTVWALHTTEGRALMGNSAMTVQASAPDVVLRLDPHSGRY